MVAQTLHWVMAAMLLYLILFSEFEHASDAEMINRIKLHSGIGTLIVILGIGRWLWRRTKPRPLPIETASRWQSRAADIVHHLFYGLFLLSPALGAVLAGLVSYRVEVFGLVDISGWLRDSVPAADLVNSFHGFSADIMLVLIIVHVAAAFYHHLVKKNGLIWRMLPFSR